MIISNSTPLINFAAIRRLDILEQLFGKIHIPNSRNDGFSAISGLNV